MKDSYDKYEHKCTVSNRSCFRRRRKRETLEPIGEKQQKQLNRVPAEVDAVVELILLLSLVATTSLAKVNGSTHEQQSRHDDRKDFLDPGRHVMRSRRPGNPAQERERKSIADSFFVVSLGGFSEKLPKMDVENTNSDDNGDCHQDHGEKEIFAQ